MKRLANLKNNSESNSPSLAKQKKNAIKNNPYPESGRAGQNPGKGIPAAASSLASPTSRSSLNTESHRARSESSATDLHEEHVAWLNGNGNADDPSATVIWFGKHKGTRLDKLEERYRRLLVHLSYENPSGDVSV